MVNEVSAKTMKGATLMVLRTVVLYPVGFAGEVLLARLLTPHDFGVYAIASFITVTLSAVLEVGLAASLIQRPEEPSNAEYQTLFTLQTLGISSLVLTVFAVSPWVFPLFAWDVNIRWPLLALLSCPWISSFGTISCVKLERDLRYAVFARIDVLRGFSYIGLAVLLAFLGWGAWSFVVAIIVSTIVKTGVAFRSAPWRVGFRLNLAGMGNTLRFGVLFQLSTLTSLFRDHIAVVLAGPLFGPQSVGYLNWAKNMTYYTSQIFTQVVSRVAFPSMSRVQNDFHAVSRMAETILKYVNLFTFPVILIFAALIRGFVQVVFTSKWAPAIPAFYFYSVRMLGSNVTTLFISVLNALGLVRTSLRVLVWWTLADWALAVVLCPWLGFSAVAVAYGLSVFPISFWLIRELRRHVVIDLTNSLYRPLLYSIAAVTPILLLQRFVGPSWLSLVLLSLIGLATYLGFLFLGERRMLLEEGSVFLRTVFKRSPGIASEPEPSS